MFHAGWASSQTPEEEEGAKKGLWLKLYSVTYAVK